jgi:hypothetical protein
MLQEGPKNGFLEPLATQTGKSRASSHLSGFCAKRRDTPSKNLSWMYDSAIRKSKRGPSTALRAREKHGRGKDARNSAQDDGATSGLSGEIDSDLGAFC